MRLEKAIEMLERDVRGDDTITYEERKRAIGLGIEALKLNLSMRETYHAPELLVLPGETEEET